MEEHAVRIAPAARREIRKLDKTTQERVVKFLEKLAADSRPSGVEKLSQDPRFWRARVGDYRVIYTIFDQEMVVVVLIVRHRSNVYRNIAILNERLALAGFANPPVAPSSASLN